MSYTNVMDSLYTSANMLRTVSFDDWHEHDGRVLNEYTNMGGAGLPDCEIITVQPF